VPSRKRQTPRSTADPSLRLKAIGLMALATIAFACLDATAKYLVTVAHVPVGEVVWVRFVAHVVFSLAVLWPLALKPSFRSKKPGLLWTLAGGAVVILSGLYLFARERRLMGPRKSGPASDIASQ
jgi:EamA domain-containing membrane protein RarD